jgi:hypothetical protein
MISFPEHDPIWEPRIAEVLYGRRGLEPGIVVEPAENPGRYALLLATRTPSGTLRLDEVEPVVSVRGRLSLKYLAVEYRSQSNFDLNGGP